MGIGAVSLNMVWNPAIKGSNFLQASVKGIHTYAVKVTKANLLQSTKFSLLNRNLKQLDNHLGHIRKQTAKISANPIKLDIETSRTSLKEARKDMTAIEHDAKQVAFYTKKASENLQAGVNSYRSQVQNKNVPASKYSSHHSVTSTVVAGVTVASVLTLPFKASIDFESKMARVKAISGATDSEFKALNSTALQLGKSTEWSAGSVAEGMQFLTMAGFNAKQTISAIPGLLSLATAGATDLATTSDIASNIMGGFSIDPKSTINGMAAMNYVSDVLAKTITSANVDIRMLGDTMQYVAPVAKTAGMSLQETAAMAGLLGNIGIQGSMAGTTLKSMLTRLAAPPTEAKKALLALGVTTKDLKGNLKSVPLILAEVSKATRGMGNAKQLEYMSKIFGLEPMAGASKLVELSGKGKLQDYIKIVNDYKGTAQKIADIQLASTAGQFKLLSSAMEGLSISATTGLLPTIQMVTNGLTSAASAVSDFTAKYPEASKWVFGLGAAFVAGSIALAGFGIVASGVAAAIGFISLPVVAVIAGVTALVAAGVALYKNWDTIKTKAGLVWSSISQSIKKPFVGVFEWIESKFLKVMKIKDSISSFFGFGDDKEKKEKTIHANVLQPANNISSKTEKKESSFFASVKEFFHFKSDTKSTIVPGQNKTVHAGVIQPANNVTLRSTLLKDRAIKEVPLPRVSEVTNRVIQEKQTLMQERNNSTIQGVQQTITNHITVHAAENGQVDYEDLKEKISRAQRELAEEEQHLQMQDVS
jgi:TP901 family phage tail tape measure protein